MTIDSTQSNSSTLIEKPIVTPEDEWSDNSNSSTHPLKRKKTSGKSGRRTWTKDEDVKLCELVIKYNQKHWKYIAKGSTCAQALLIELATQRSETECRQHFCRVLSRNTRIGRWSCDEVERLRKAVNDGLNWNEVAAYVGTRDKTQCRAKWTQITEKDNKQFVCCCVYYG